MNGLYLTLPIFLPLVGGLVSYLIRFPSTRSRHLFYGVLICLTSAVTWLSILRCGSESFQLLRFTEELTLTLRMDGASRLFAGLAATLWPFTMLYAFDYMSHEKHLSMFWSFFTVSFGVTLGVAIAGNMMTMYLFYELLTLATLPLVMQPTEILLIFTFQLSMPFSRRTSHVNPSVFLFITLLIMESFKYPSISSA